MAKTDTSKFNVYPAGFDGFRKYRLSGEELLELGIDDKYKSYSVTMTLANDTESYSGTTQVVISDVENIPVDFGFTSLELIIAKEQGLVPTLKVNESTPVMFEILDTSHKLSNVEPGYYIANYSVIGSDLGTNHQCYYEAWSYIDAEGRTDGWHILLPKVSEKYYSGGLRANHPEDVIFTGTINPFAE